MLSRKKPLKGARKRVRDAIIELHAALEQAGDQYPRELRIALRLHLHIAKLLCDEAVPSIAHMALITEAYELVKANVEGHRTAVNQNEILRGQTTLTINAANKVLDEIEANIDSMSNAQITMALNGIEQTEIHDRTVLDRIDLIRQVLAGET